MENKKATTKDKVHPDLLVSPHIMHELFQVIMGELRPDTSQQEHMVNHLRYCEYCRTSLIILLSAEQEHDRLSRVAEPSIDNLLTQFVTIHHEIAIHDYEHMGAYAEAIKDVGRKEAAKRFPVIEGHIRRCVSCKAWLEETLAFLNESEENF
jgi:hypothetical protein